jgi:hypothetical protein
VPRLTDFGGASTTSIEPGFIAQSTFEPGMAKFRDAVCHEFVHGIVIQQCGHLLCERPGTDGKYAPDEASEAKGLG